MSTAFLPWSFTKFTSHHPSLPTARGGSKCRCCTFFFFCFILLHTHARHLITSFSIFHLLPSIQSFQPTASIQICFAACKDDETSADTFQGGVAVGAMSYVKIPSPTFINFPLIDIYLPIGTSQDPEYVHAPSFFFFSHQSSEYRSIQNQI